MMINYIVAQPLIGGMALGFEQDFGCKPLAIITCGFSNDTHYINYMNNVKNLDVPVINMSTDYTEFKSQKDEELYNTITKNKIDVLVHVAVCSGLSQMNSCNSGSKARGNADNDQNKNMYNLTRLGMRMSAKVVAFENAPTAYTKSGESVINVLKEIADEFNYSTHLFKTDTLLHGIPQSRKRTFITFFKNSKAPLFNFEHKEYIKLEKYIVQIPKSLNLLQSNEYIIDEFSALDDLYSFLLKETQTKSFLECISVIEKTYNICRDTWTSAQLIEVIGFDKALTYLEENKLHKSYKTVQHYKSKKMQGKSFWDNTSILANKGEYTNAIVGKSLTSMINPKYECAYSIRELLHLMGMPSDFELIEPKKNWNHICQNVPVTTAKYIASQISLFLDGNLKLSNYNFVKQDNIKQKTDVGDI